MEVISPPPLLIDSIATFSISCFGFDDGEAQVLRVSNNQGPVSYQWSANANNETTAQVDNLSKGNYEVVITDSEGCSTSANIFIEEPELLSLDFVVRELSCTGEENAKVVATPGGGISDYSYQWMNGDTTQLLDNVGAGIYEVMVTDQNGVL